MNIGKDEVAERLGPHHATIYDALHAAHGRLRSSAVPLLPTAYSLYPVAKRAMMFALTTEEIRLRFDDVPGCRVLDLPNKRFALRVGPPQGALVLSFKHAFSDLRTANYPTQGALEFEAQVDMDDMPRGARIRVCHVLNQLETEIVAVLVMYRRGKDVVWYYEIGNDASAIEPQVIPIIGEPPLKRIEVKKSGGKQESKGE